MQQKGTEVLAVRVVTLLYDLVTEKVSALPALLPSHFAICFWHSILAPFPVCSTHPFILISQALNPGFLRHQGRCPVGNDC